MSKVAVTYVGRDAELAASLLEWSEAIETITISFQDFQHQQEEENARILNDAA